MQTSLYTSNQTGASSQAASGSSNSAVSDMFTKLLVAQVKNQDPLSPSDPGQFVNQLTQLSQMESLQQLAALGSSNASVLQSMQMLSLGSQVGANLTVATDSVTLGSGAVNGSFSLANATSSASLVLTGSDGVKHTIPLGPQDAGEVAFTIDPALLGLSGGTYSIKVASASGEAPSVGITGELTNVKLSSSGSALLNVANVGQVLPSAITQFNGRSTTATN